MSNTNQAAIIRLGHRNLLGRGLSPNQTRKLLLDVPVDFVAETIARISSLLRNASDPNSAQTQRSILDGLAPQLGAGAYARLDRSLARKSNGAGRAQLPIMFEDVPLRMTFELSLQNPDPKVAVSVAEAHYRIARAILSCNDYVDDGSILTAPAFRFLPVGLPKWAHLEFLLQIARYQDADLNAIARNFDVLETRYAASARPGYAKLQAAIRARTGGDLVSLFAVMFSLQIQQRSISSATAPTTNAWFDLSSLWDPTVSKLQRREVEAVVELVACDALEARRRVRSQLRGAMPPPYDNSRSFITPLLRSGNAACAPIANLLYAKLGFGLYLTLQFLLPTRERADFQRDIGDMFEEYVRDLFSRIASDTGVLSFDESQLYAALGKVSEKPKLCDGIITDGDQYLIWDAKSAYGDASFFSGDFAAFSAHYHKLVGRCSEQFQSTIALVESGAFERAGIKRSLKLVGAFVVPWLHLPDGPHLTRYVRTIAAETLSTDYARLVRIVSIESLEFLEPCLLPSSNVISMLGAFASSSELVLGLRNHLLASGLTGYATTKSKILGAAYDHAVHRILACVTP